MSITFKDFGFYDKKKINSNEIFKEIEGFQNYQVSNYGRIKNVKTRKIIKVSEASDRLYARLTKDNVSYFLWVHVLVAKAFINNPNNCPLVAHKDKNMYNNEASNLKWINYDELNLEPLENTFDFIPRREEKVNQYDFNGLYIKTILTTNYNIISSARGKSNSAFGYMWGFWYNDEKCLGIKSYKERYKQEPPEKNFYIAQYQVETNRLLQVYPSIKKSLESIKAYGYKAISDCLKGRKVQAYGYEWHFL